MAETTTTWDRTLKRFEGGMGGPPDFSDWTDRHTLAQLLCEEVGQDEARRLLTAHGVELPKWL